MYFLGPNNGFNNSPYQDIIYAKNGLNNQLN